MKPNFRVGEKAKVRLNTQSRVIDEKSRIVEFTGSTESVDRYGTSLRGWELGEYRQNPVFLYGHDYVFPPIGAAKRVWLDRDRKLQFRIAYVPAELFPFAEFIYQMVKGQWIRATSVGFIPGDVRYPDKEGDPVLLLRNSLLELSQVTVPANPEALANGFRSLKPSDEYVHLCAANTNLATEKMIDGMDVENIRAAVLAWADDVGWSGEVEDESTISAQVPEDIEARSDRHPVAEAPTDAVVETAPEAEAVVEAAEGAEPVQVAVDGLPEGDADDEAEEGDASGEGEGGEGEGEGEPEARAAAPQFRVSWDATAGGMAQILMGEYVDDSPAEDFLRLVAGYESHGKRLPSMIVEDREVPVNEIDPAVLIEGGPVDFVFHEGEDDIWRSKREVVLKHSTGAPVKPLSEASDAEEAAEAPDVSIAAQGAPDLRTPATSVTFGGGGGGGGKGPRSAPVFKNKVAAAPVGELAAISEELAKLQAELHDEMDEIRDAVTTDSISEAIAELGESLEETAEDRSTVAVEVSVVVSEEEDDAEGEMDPMDPAGDTEEEPVTDSCPTCGQETDVCPDCGQPVRIMTVPGGAANIAEEIRDAVRSALADDCVRMVDLTDLALALGVPAWLDYRGEGRTCADYIAALSAAAEEKRTAPLASDDLSEVLAKLKDISDAVCADGTKEKSAVGEIGRALASRRRVSEETLDADLGTLAAEIESRASAVNRSVQTVPTLRKRRNGRHNNW